VTIDKPGVYDLDDETYHGDPCPTPSLSAGTAKLLLEATPRHAADAHPRLRLADLPEAEDEDEPKFDVGKACHMLVTGKGGEIVEITPLKKDGTPSTSKATASWKDQAAAARAAGKTPLSPPEAARVRLMANLLDAQLRADPEIGNNPFSNRASNELAMIWKEGDIWCRCKPDALDYDRRIIWDLKTTGLLADPDRWTDTQVKATGVDLRAAHYLRGAAQLLGTGWRYVFVVCEAQRPHAMSVIELPGAYLEMGEDKRRRAVSWWTRCLTSGSWPGWRQGIQRPEPAAYLEARWLERRDNHPSGDALAAAAAFQSPG
jgi:hypothetical protein